MRPCKGVWVAGLLPLVAAVGSASAQWPSSVAGLGTSITRAVVADDSTRGTDYGQPQHSWSVGYKGSEGVYSHFERIKAANPYANISRWNFAASGAEVYHLPWQAWSAVQSGAEYVAIEMGANDVCAENTWRMTPTSDFYGYYNWALDILQRGLPDATILVTEVPRLRRVYDVGKNDLWCRWKWAAFGNCGNVLRNGRTQRNQADARNIEYNNYLRWLCAQRGIPFADNVFEWQFAKKNLSQVDCFHPDRSGQNWLSHLTYRPGLF